MKNVKYVYTLPWMHYYSLPYHLRFYKSDPYIELILRNLTHRQVEFIYDMHCNRHLNLDIIYFINLFSVNDYY